MSHEQEAETLVEGPYIYIVRSYPETVDPSEDRFTRRRAMDHLGLSYATQFDSERGPLTLPRWRPMDPYLNRIDRNFDPYALVNGMSSWYSGGMAPVIAVTIEVTQMSPPARYVKRDRQESTPPRMIFHASLLKRRDQFVAHTMTLMREYHSDMLYPDQAAPDRAGGNDDGDGENATTWSVHAADDSWIRYTRGFEWRCTTGGHLPPRCRAETLAPLRAKMRTDHRLVGDTYHGLFPEDICGAHWLPEHDRACNGRFQMVHHPNADEERQLQETHADILMRRRQNEASNRLLRRRLQDLHEKRVLRELRRCRERNRAFYLDGMYLE